jgi:hypothetical protein
VGVLKHQAWADIRGLEIKIICPPQVSVLMTEAVSMRAAVHPIVEQRTEFGKAAE